MPKTSLPKRSAGIYLEGKACFAKEQGQLALLLIFIVVAVAKLLSDAFEKGPPPYTPKTSRAILK